VNRTVRVKCAVIDGLGAVPEPRDCYPPY